MGSRPSRLPEAGTGQAGPQQAGSRQAGSWKARHTQDHSGAPLPKTPRLPARGRIHAFITWLPAFLLAACLVQQGGEEVFFDLEADPGLAGYSRLTILLQDSLGNGEDTLFDDTLRSLDQLRRLPAGPYRGGAARIVLVGWKDGEAVYRETRIYDGAGQRVDAVYVHVGPGAPGSREPESAASRPPSLVAAMRDTTVSIGDSVAFWAQALDPDGDLAGYGLDCDGDGTPEDSGSLSGYRADIHRGRRFPDTGSHACELRVWDRWSLSVGARLGVRVELDPPVADAGRDTVVEAGTLIELHALGEDRFGPIVTREWRIGAKPYQPVPHGHTTIEAPLEPGPLICILRITDSDRLTDEDTLVVTVIPRRPPR